MLLPDDAPVRRRPDLPAPLRICSPVGAGCLVQQNDLARGQIRPRSATVTEYAPLAASAVRFVDPATSIELPVVENSDGPTTISGEGCAPAALLNGLAPSVFASVV